MKCVLSVFLFFHQLIIPIPFSLPISSFHITNLPQANSSICLNTTPAFGHTHFIVGYKPKQQKKIKTTKNEKQSTKQISDLPFTVKTGDHICEVFFAPDDDDVCSVLCSLIEHEQERIRIAVFSFTDKDIAQALVRAKDRGVSVEIITDLSNVYNQYNKIDELKKKGVSVFIYKPQKGKSGLMHNKFGLFSKNVQDRSFLLTGSFNFTRSGHKHNRENVVIFDDKSVIRKFEMQFKSIKQNTKVHQPRSIWQ